MYYIYLILFLFLLTPPPIEIAFSIGSRLSELTSQISFKILILLKQPVSLSLYSDTPYLTLTHNDQSIKFIIDIACSGLYSLIGFIIFSLFLSYTNESVISGGQFNFSSIDNIPGSVDTSQRIINEQLLAFNNVRIYKSDLQGLCDSLSFSFKDSLMYMYNNPILWNTNNQMTGDTITLPITNQKLEMVELSSNDYMVNKSFFKMYIQIRR